MVKIVSLFLIGILVLAMFGRLRWPGAAARKRNAAAKPKACPRCGSYIIGSGGCPCGKPPANKG